MSDSERTLMDLPPEMVENVSGYLEPQDLLNLRFVNKYIAGSSQRPMLKANFAELHIMLSLRSSLQRPLRVARSTHLRKHICGIHIYIDRFQPRVLESRSLLHPSEDDESSKDGKHYDHRRVYRQWLNDQEWLARTGNDQCDLREIFYHLRSFPHIEVDVLGIDDNSQKPRDFRSIVAEYGQLLSMWPNWTNDRPLKIILSAIVESQFHLEAFFVASDGYNVLLPMFAPNSELWKVRDNFSRLTHLGLLIQAGTKGPDSLSSIEALSNFVAFLDAAAATLVMLQLNADHEIGQEYYDDSDIDHVFRMMMTTTVIFPRMEKICLSNLAADYSELLRTYPHTAIRSRV